MKNPPNPDNNTNNQCLPPCPISQMAAESIKKLSESYDDLSSAAAKMSATEECPEFLAQKAWQRTERVGQVLDNLLNHWERGCCVGLCFDCEWLHTERGLAIINTLTPCNQWFAPELWAQLEKMNSQASENSEIGENIENNESQGDTKNQEI